MKLQPSCLYTFMLLFFTCFEPGRSNLTYVFPSISKSQSLGHSSLLLFLCLWGFNTFFSAPVNALPNFIQQMSSFPFFSGCSSPLQNCKFLNIEVNKCILFEGCIFICCNFSEFHFLVKRIPPLRLGPQENNLSWSVCWRLLFECHCHYFASLFLPDLRITDTITLWLFLSRWLKKKKKKKDILFQYRNPDFILNNNYKTF